MDYRAFLWLPADPLAATGHAEPGMALLTPAVAMLREKPVMLGDFLDRDDMTTCLRASANVPAIAGSPIHHRGHCLVDAAVFEPIPFPMALRDGCSHVLVLCSRPDPQLRPTNPLTAPLKRYAVELVRKAVLSPPYMRTAWSARLEQESVLGMSVDEMLLLSMEESMDELPVGGRGGHIYPLYPGPLAAFAPLCIDPPTIRTGLNEGRRAVEELFKGLV